MELYEEIAARDDTIARTRENTARQAQVNAKFTSNGQGSIQFPKRIDFGLTYIDEPWMNYGSYVDLDALADVLNLDADSPDAIPLPLVSGFVVDWDQDDRDFYVGAWVAVRVYFPLKVGVYTGPEPDEGPWPPLIEVDVPVDAAVKVDHYFTFQGTALKDVPTDGAGD